jgi:hypothetical protein
MPWSEYFVIYLFCLCLVAAPASLPLLQNLASSPGNLLLINSPSKTSDLLLPRLANSDALNQVLEVVRFGVAQTAAIQKVVLDLQAQMQKKKRSLFGSQMTENCVACFHQMAQTCKQTAEADEFDQDKLIKIRALIQTYSESMKTLFERKKFAEMGKGQVQELSFALFKSVCEAYFPPRVLENFEFHNKSTCVQKTQYTTVLMEEDGGLIYVRGQTDSTLYYCDVPVATWEDKKLTLGLQTPAEIGQALVEVRAFGESFAKTARQIPLIFSGILTSGLAWSLFLRSYKDYDYSYTRTIPVSTYNATTKLIIPENINAVAILMMKHLDAISRLIDLVDKERKARNRPSVDVGDDVADLLGDEDDRDDGGAGGRSNQDPSLPREFLSLSITDPSRGNQSNKENEKTSSGKSGGSHQANGGKSVLTNLNKHNRLTSSGFFDFEY